jgi:hypothetical protein
MKKLLFAAFIFVIACNKDHPTATKSPAVVHYSFHDSAITITDTTAGSKAIWVLTRTVSKGYGLEAYNSISGGEIHDMISIFIKTGQLKTGYQYSSEVNGSILRNSGDNPATEDLPETYIRITITDQSNNKLSGTFTAHLKNLNTNEYYDASGDFKNVPILAE